MKHAARVNEILDALVLSVAEIKRKEQKLREIMELARAKEGLKSEEPEPNA